MSALKGMYAVRAEGTGKINNGEIEAFFNGVAKQLAQDAGTQPVRCGFTFLSQAGEHVPTLALIETPSEQHVERCIQECARYHLVVLRVEDAANNPKMAAAIRGNTVLRKLLPEGVPIDNEELMRGHVGDWLDMLEGGLEPCMMDGTRFGDTTRLELVGFSLTPAEEGSTVITLLSIVVRISAGPHRGMTLFAHQTSRS